jgi:hypothetical protein
MNYPTKATFSVVTETKGSFGEWIETANVAFSTGVRAKTVAFKDKLSNGQKLSGEQLYLYTRKNPNTLSVSVGDSVELQGRAYEVKGIDADHSQWSEMVFFVDRKEA